MESVRAILGGRPILGVRGSRRAVVAFLIAVSWVGVSNAQQRRAVAGPTQPPAAAAPSPTDRDLLNDIPTVGKPSRPSGLQPPGSGLRVPPGEDFGAPGEEGRGADPLAGIIAKMVQVHQRIQKQDTSAGTQATQQQIVTELAALIRQLEAQCQKNQGSKPSGSPSTSAQASASKPAPGGKPTKSQGKSADATRTNDAGSESKAQDTSALMKDVWGQLPEKVRQQIRNVAPDQFLPKYERMIAEYYKRLAEQGERGTGNGE